MLLLSAGDFYAKSGIAELYRSRFVSSMMIELGYSAVAVGENELGYGLRAILEDAEAGLPVICANLYRDGERLFPPFIIKNVRGNRIGIFAIIDEYPKEQESIEIRDPVSEGAQILSELESECDYTILLAHMRKEKLIDILPAFEGVDLVIRGHAEKGAKVSDDCADDLGGQFDDLGLPVLYAGEKGKAVGLAVLAPGGKGRAVLTDTTLVHLGKDMPRDEEMADRMKKFGAEEGARLREMSLSEFLSRDAVTGKIRERYLSISVCSRCHYELTAEFMTTPHFRAFNRLTVAGEETNPSCLQCHTTGYGHFSGYSIKAEEGGGLDLRGVQCEACHGPGTLHTRDGKYKANARASCRACHTPQQDPDFDLMERMKGVRHCMGADSTAAKEDVQGGNR